MIDQDFTNTILSNLNYIILFIFLEIFEAQWQKADTFNNMLMINYKLFIKNPIWYFFMHPSFIYSMYLTQSMHNYGFLMISIVVMKFLDIAFKLYLIQTIINNKYDEITKTLPINAKITFFTRYSNTLIYPITFIFTLFH